MTAQLIREAFIDGTRSVYPYPTLQWGAMLQIDMIRWESRTPLTEQEAATINNDARVICEKLSHGN